MTRRRLLLALYIVVLAATNGHGALPNPYTVEDIINSRCSPGQACYPSAARIQQLSNDMDGYITRKGDPNYNKENLMYNRHEQVDTSIIAMVKSKADIQKAVLFAREFNLHVTIKSTGHDYAGRSTWADSFVIHLGYMKNVEVNPSSTARSAYGELKTETGTNWEAIYRKVDGYDRVVVGGSAHTVGPGGYTLGGGHSPISRSLGYAVDNVLEMQVVLPDGSIATCTENQTIIEHVNGTTETRNDGDLLWALRGGGGGTFGVTVYIVFKLHRSPSQMVLFSGLFPLTYVTESDQIVIDAYDQVMGAMKNFILNSPSHWGGYWLLSGDAFQYQTVHMRGKLFLFINKFGPWDSNTETELSEFLEIAKTYKLKDIRLENKTSFLDYEINAHDPPSADVYLAASMLDEAHARDNLLSFYRDELFNRWRDKPFGCTGILVGDKTTEPAVSSAPLNPGYRSAVSVMSCGVSLEYGYESILIGEAKNFSYRIRKMGEGMYFNEASIDSRYWKEDFWGIANYARLVKIKKQYDPDNFFTCYHCVNSETWPYPGKETDGSAQTDAHWFTLTLAALLATVTKNCGGFTCYY